VGRARSGGGRHLAPTRNFFFGRFSPLERDARLGDDDELFFSTTGAVPIFFSRSPGTVASSVTGSRPFFSLSGWQRKRAWCEYDVQVPALVAHATEPAEPDVGEEMQARAASSTRAATTSDVPLPSTSCQPRVRERSVA